MQEQQGLQLPGAASTLPPGIEKQMAEVDAMMPAQEGGEDLVAQQREVCKGFLANFKLYVCPKDLNLNNPWT